MKITITVALMLILIGPTFADDTVIVTEDGTKVTIDEGSVVVKEITEAKVDTNKETGTVVTNPGSTSDVVAGDSVVSLKTLVCSGKADMTLTNRIIQTTSDGVVVSEHGTLILKDSQIQAGKTGVKVIDNGTATLKGCVIEGKVSGLVIGNNATVSIQNCTISGVVVKTGNADLIDLGGNVFVKEK